MSLSKQFYSITVKLLLPLLILVMLVQLIIPAIGVHYLKKWYGEQGNNYELAINSWSFVPWRGFLSLGGVVFRHDSDVSSIDEINVNVGVLDLLKKTITLESLLFDGLKLDIKRDDVSINVLGLPINTITSENKNDSTGQLSEEVVESDPWSFKIKSIDIKNHQLGWMQPDLNISLEINTINVINLKNANGLMLNSLLTLKQLSMNDNEIVMSKPMSISVNGEIKNVFEQPEFMGQLELASFSVKTQAVSGIDFERLVLTDIDISANKQTLGLLELEGLAIGENLLALQHYEIKDIKLNDSALTTGLHEFSGLNSVVEFSQDNSISGLTMAKTPEVANTNRSQQDKAVNINSDNTDSVFEIGITGIQQAKNDEGNIRIINRSVDPEMDLTFKVNHFRLSDVNNIQKPLNFSLIASTDEYSKIDLDASMNLADKPNGSVKLNIEQFDLITLSGYVEKAIGYHVKQGQFNYGMNLNIENGNLAGEGKLKITSSLMEPSDKGRMDQISKQISMPIETVLSIIKDDNNNIVMTVPIKGDMSSPDFGLDDLISQVGQKALMAASLHYIKQAIFPYGLLMTLADYASDEIFSITLTPIEYENDELTDEQLKYLDKVLKIMQDKESLQLYVCPEVNEKGTLEESWYSSALEKANRIKRVMVSKDKEISGRIVLCQPKLSDKTQVKLGF
ncbi:MAG: DUF748 domain-containing protein [Bermanella sp.]